jgi:signal transduction histidine kinase
LREEAEDMGTEAHVPGLLRIEEAGKHLLGLVNDVLDFSKIAAGRMEVNAETFEAAPLLHAVVEGVQPIAKKNANRLTVNIEREIGALHTDPQRVRQVLFNLLSNACKFTKDGEVTVRARRQRNPGGDWVVFEVQDTGVGMSDEQVARLFQEFVQADNTTTRQFGGTGLGLAISQRFCQMMGGSIEVQSAAGVGSLFTVRLPRPTSSVVHARVERHPQFVAFAAGDCATLSFHSRGW